MKKILWIVNKYVTGNKDQAYYPDFLKYLQDELKGKDVELHFVFFSDLMKGCILGNNNHFYNAGDFNEMTKNGIQKEAQRIEKEYAFTFKQAWFPDILQTSKKQNGRKISVPENELNDLYPLVKKFLYLEDLIQSENFNVILSDVSPEVEMEFGRAIGLKYNIPVIKSYEGSFLGRLVLLKHTKFGEDKLIESIIHPNYSIEEAEKFLDDYTKNEGQPSYVGAHKLTHKISSLDKALVKLKNNGFGIIFYPFKVLIRILYISWLWIESTVLKKMIYDKFEPNKPYIFFGFHLNQESTMALRSMPYMNQTALIEMLSRVLPYGYTLYVREHPHWPKTFPYLYLKRCKTYPNVKLLSPKISIHDILKNSSGVLVYNSNTGIEALMHGKPVLSFASNIYYKYHSAVIHCTNLYELGEKLTKLINTKVKKVETIKYLQKLTMNSLDFNIGSDHFLSNEDAKEKAMNFSEFLKKGIN
ncbi:hypothetical protein OAK09_02290 [Candidatus Marinimicrobia bacterium]|nr:hypothetical protein [Candidatus Neomarinimicrobiota bacterium]